MGMGQNTMVRGFDIPWVGGQNTMDRGSKYQSYRVQHTMGRVQNTMDTGINLPWVGD